MQHASFSQTVYQHGSRRNRSEAKSRHGLLLLLLLAMARTAAPEPLRVNFDLDQLQQLLPQAVRDVLGGKAELRSGFHRDSMVFVQAALREAVPGLAESPQWATLYGRYGGATREAVARFETEVLGLPHSDGASISADTVSHERHCRSRCLPGP
jgi:hypothetical protein